VAAPGAWRGCVRQDAVRIKAGERGAAVVDFVLVGGLLTLFFMAIIQLTLVLHVRNTLIDAAASGARYGTLADRSAADARDRTAQLIGVALSPDFAGDVSTGEATYQGVPALVVTVRAPLPVIGLIGPRGILEVKGHAALRP
jgi:Flp pilus assembly protein TadG